MELINVNTSKCIKCGICSKVCPTSTLFMDEAGPKVANENNCIGCGQCVSVCPNEAIDNIKTPISKQEKIAETLDSKTAENFLRSRRSIRAYKDKAVDRQKLLELTKIAHYAPTASNSQNISYIIVENKHVLEEATKIIVEWMEKKLENPSTAHWSFSRHVNNYRNAGIDTILRNAPHLILAIAPKGFKNGRESSISALSYLELYAPTLGLGSCWAGLFEYCIFSNYEPLLKLFNIPEDKVVTGAVMVGYPKYKFKRLVDRNELEVNFI